MRAWRKLTGLVCVLLAPVCIPHAAVCVPHDPVCTLLAPERVPLIIWDLRGTRKRKKYGFAALIRMTRTTAGKRKVLDGDGRPLYLPRSAVSARSGKKGWTMPALRAPPHPFGRTVNGPPSRG